MYVISLRLPILEEKEMLLLLRYHRRRQGLSSNANALSAVLRKAKNLLRQTCSSFSAGIRKPHGSVEAALPVGPSRPFLEQSA